MVVNIHYNHRPLHVRALFWRPISNYFVTLRRWVINPSSVVVNAECLIAVLSIINLIL